MTGKAEEKLQRARADYKRAYGALLINDNANEQDALKRAYMESHNFYVLQLRATNAISDHYQNHCLPGLLGEIAEVYEELCTLACKCIMGISEAAGERANEQSKRYQLVVKEATTISPINELQVTMLIMLHRHFLLFRYQFVLFRRKIFNYSCLLFFFTHVSQRFGRGGWPRTRPRENQPEDYSSHRRHRTKLR